ncbi:MAG: hypothetical protein FWG25_06330 [Promicromonosporaceae bacterium]|nr:hypothetical protein [Promicromonosporaceae bacterium]
MPTTLPRTSITHLPEVEEILASGRLRWPSAKPGEILVNLAAIGTRNTSGRGVEYLHLLDDVDVDEAALSEALGND